MTSGMLAKVPRIDGQLGSTTSTSVRVSPSSSRSSDWCDAVISNGVPTSAPKGEPCLRLCAPRPQAGGPSGTDLMMSGCASLPHVRPCSEMTITK